MPANADFGAPGRHPARSAWRCGDCGYEPAATSIGKSGPKAMTCPRCRGDFTWTLPPNDGSGTP
jgi:hypothetical protein